MRVRFLPVCRRFADLGVVCSRAQQYELRGQVLAVDRARQEITIKHDDIRGFMPGMTMPFKVREAGLLDAAARGTSSRHAWSSQDPTRICRRSSARATRS